MKKQSPTSIEQYVIPPDGGIITRFPSNQTWRKNYSGLAVASNVRAAAGRLYNAPGYEEAIFYPPITTSPVLIWDAELTQGTYHVLGDCNSLYAVGPAFLPSVNPGQGGVVAALSFFFADALATGYLGQTLGVTWSLLSGPGSASFDDPGLVNATVTVTVPGLYTFNLSGSDGVNTVNATTTVRFITCTASPNYTFPTSSGGILALTGIINGVSNPSDPLSDGSSYIWSQVSGPATVVFSSTSALSPTATVPGTAGSYVLKLTASVGATSKSSSVTVVVPPGGGGVPLDPFDFAILRYIWTSADGRDLDTRTAFIATDPSVDDTLPSPRRQVGYGFSGVVQDGSSNDLLTWGGDNTTPDGDEAVLINFPQTVTDFPGVDPITIRMRAHWYWPSGLRIDGYIKIQFETYLGGTMVPFTTGSGQTDWNNVGGVLVQNIQVDRNVTTYLAPPIAEGDEMGTLVYNPTTKTASIMPP